MHLIFFSVRWWLKCHWILNTEGKILLLTNNHLFIRINENPFNLRKICILTNSSDTAFSSKQIVFNIWNSMTINISFTLIKKCLIITEIIRFEAHGSQAQRGEPKPRHPAPRRPSERRQRRYSRRHFGDQQTPGHRWRLWRLVGGTRGLGPHGRDEAPLPGARGDLAPAGHRLPGSSPQRQRLQVR